MITVTSSLHYNSVMAPSTERVPPTSQPSTGQEAPNSNVIIKAFKKESKRTKQFNTFLRELQHDFHQAEQAQKQFGVLRIQKFKLAQSERCELFTKNEKNRIRQFEEADTERQHTFRSSEDRHMAIFEDSEATRKKEFHESLEKHDKEVESVITHLKTIFLMGRQLREELIRRSFGVILQDSGTGHFADSTSLGADNVSPMSSIPDSDTHSDDRDTYDGPSTYAEFQDSYDELYEAPDTTTEKDDYRLLSSSSLGAGASMTWKQIDSLFEDRRAQRKTAFERRLSDNEASFQTAEQKRDQAIETLESQFDQQRYRFEKHFESSRKSFENRFQTKESYRDQVETSRDALFQHKMVSFRVMSEQRLFKRIKVLEDAEDHHIMALQDLATERIRSTESILAPILFLQSRAQHRVGENRSSFTPNILISFLQRDSLPIPNSIPDTPECLDSTTSQIDVHLAAYDDLFDQDQNDMRKQEEKRLEKRQQIFAMNETRRQDDFRDQQMDRIRRSDEREANHSLVFANDQRQREKIFLGGQALRRKMFLEKEEERTVEFNTFLRQWEFPSKDDQNHLLSDAFDGEIKRVQSFDQWVRDIIFPRKPVAFTLTCTGPGDGGFGWWIQQ
ncbi:hypothetical protein QCA50_013328 [Cerrena zonata]|uniref:Uncharacterized protein n=1 Tax=Cerrena zonata TaxID=2478898 RepID=A0AAW0FWM3_9APHY